MSIFYTFAPISRLEIIRSLLAIAIQKGLKAFQLDVKPTFLNDFLKEEIYVKQLEGYLVKGHEDEVYL